MEQKKPWYQSKIVLLAITAFFTIGTNLATGWLTGQGVTQDQINAVAATQPAVAEAIDDYQAGQGVLNSVSVVVFASIALIRKWFTSSLLS
jgi:hypothetical protein